MTEITIGQIWHLRGLSEPPDRWYFTANYKLDLENSMLRNRLQGQTNPPLSLEESHLLFSEKAEALAEHPEGVIAPPRKVTVFISYRRSHLETAQRLHGILQSLGGGTIFDPYLDLHDMQSGKWKPQLLEHIESSTLFMPLVSSDYGEDGSVGQEEYAKAKEVAAAEGFDDFFVPIILGEATTEVAKDLLEYDAYLAASTDDVDLELGAFEAWIGRVAEAGFRRSVTD